MPIVEAAKFYSEICLQLDEEVLLDFWHLNTERLTQELLNCPLFVNQL